MCYDSVGRNIESGNFRDAVNILFDLVNYGNKYYDINKPWVTRTEDPILCAQTIYTCVQLAANLAVLFHPFIPGSSEKIESWLGIDEKWEVKSVPSGTKIKGVSLLYERIDKKRIDQEVEYLKQQAAGI